MSNSHISLLAKLSHEMIVIQNLQRDRCHLVKENFPRTPRCIDML